jgi:hypothetical protein
MARKAKLTGITLVYFLPFEKTVLFDCRDGQPRAGAVKLLKNNLAGNAGSTIASGRKNYLFAGSAREAERAAMCYSFLGLARKIMLIHLTGSER